MKDTHCDRIDSIARTMRIDSSRPPTVPSIDPRQKTSWAASLTIDIRAFDRINAISDRKSDFTS